MIVIVKVFIHVLLKLQRYTHANVNGILIGFTSIKPDTPINVHTRFCLNTAKSKFSLVSPVADW